MMKREGFLLLESMVALSLICLGCLCFNQIYQQTSQQHQRLLHRVIVTQHVLEQAQAARYDGQLPPGKVGGDAATISW